MSVTAATRVDTIPGMQPFCPAFPLARSPSLEAAFEAFRAALGDV
jgi:hypothetical protein